MLKVAMLFAPFGKVGLMISKVLTALLHTPPERLRRNPAENPQPSCTTNCATLKRAVPKCSFCPSDLHVSYLQRNRTPVIQEEIGLSLHQTALKSSDTCTRMAETGNIKEGNSEIAYETNKLVQNWARTFECRPERYYRPNSESEVISVSSCCI